MEPYYLPGFSFLLVEASFSILIGSGQGNFLLTDPQQASCALSASQLPNIAIAVHHRHHLLDHHLKRDHDLNPDYSSNSQCQADVGI